MRYTAIVLLAAGLCVGQSIDSAVYMNPDRALAQRASLAAIEQIRAGLPRASERSLPPLDASVFAIDDGGVGPKRAGAHRTLDHAIDVGMWDALPNGRRLWRVALRSPGALGLRVHFRNFDVGSGAVWIHDGDTSVGPYTGRGIHGDGDFWSEIGSGEAVSIEYLPGDAQAVATPFEIAEISHLWEPWQEPKAGAPSAAAPCHGDVSCATEWLETAKTVARITFEKGGGSFLCSGALLITTDRSFVPYFLTAQHCMDDDTTARSVVAFWGYQTARCNGPAPTTRGLPTSLGARFITGSQYEAGDFTLLRLNNVPDGSVFAGWTADEPALGAPLVGIHHPTGDYKRISTGTRDSDSRITTVPKENFYTVRWSQGRTEGGSSGSPLFNANRQVVGTLSHGPKPPRGGTVCDVEPIDFYGRFSVDFRVLRRYLEGGGQTVNPTTQVGGVLTSGQTNNFSLASVDRATLYNGTSSYRIEVPANATRLEVRLSTGTPDVDIDVYVRFNADPAVPSGSNVIASDYRSEGPTGDETIIATPSSNPALRQGTYFIALVNRTTGRAASGTILATVTSGSSQSQAGTLLASGAPRSFRFGAVRGGTLFNGEYSYRIEVPSNATRLDIRLATGTPDVDVDLHVRFGQDPVVAGGRIVADHSSEGESGDEQVTILPSNSPPLRAGVYFITLAVWTPNRDVSGNITATVTTTSGPTAPTSAVTLTSGQAAPFAFAAVDRPTLFTGNYSMRIDVPAGSARLEIRLRSANPQVDVDMYVRRDADVDVAGDDVAADFSATRDTGNEDLVITTNSQPPLAPGTYYIALVLWSAGSPSTGTVTATVVPGIGTELLSGEARRFSLPAVAQPTAFTGNAAYRVSVPSNASSVEFKITTETPGVDVDLAVRYEQVPTVVDGELLFDYASVSETGDEQIVVDSTSSPPLASGTYYVSLTMYSTGKSAEGTVVANITTRNSSTETQEVSMRKPPATTRRK